MYTDTAIIEDEEGISEEYRSKQVIMESEDQEIDSEGKYIIL